MDARSRHPYRDLRLAVLQLRPLPPPQHVLDGSNAILVNVLKHFAELGVRITVHHPATPSRSEPIKLFPGVDVVPVPPLLSATPSGSLVADPMSHAAAIERIRQTLDRSDRFYVHGGNFPYPALGRDLPSVHSVHDFCATESVTSILNFTGDHLVAVSDYLASCLRAVLDRVRAIPSGSLRVVRNGFDADAFSRRPSAALRDELGVPATALCVLYPHRPDPDKGILEAVRVLHALRSLVPADVYRRVLLLVPEWERPRLGENVALRPPLPPEAISCAAELDVTDKIYVHRWIPVVDMARYYSMGVATLCIGRYPEAFGNVHVESSLAGTPAIVARAGAHRTSAPEGLVRKVDPGRVDEAAEHLAEVIVRAERTPPELRDFLATRYPLHEMLQGYEQAILQSGPQPPVVFSVPPPLRTGTVLRVPPWAALLASGYYHDNTGYCTDEKLVACLPGIEAGEPVGLLTQRDGIELDDVRRWLDAGLVMTA